MVRRKGAAKYIPMSSPNPERVMLPDLSILKDRNHLRLTQEIAGVARENLLSIKGPTGGVDLSPALGKLEHRLLDLLDPDEKENPPSTPAILTGARLGYLIGRMENGSGVAHAGECEVHYLLALDMVGAEVARIASPTVMSTFATECGYYLARTNDRTLDGLTKVANRYAEMLRS